MVLLWIYLWPIFLILQGIVLLAFVKDMMKRRPSWSNGALVKFFTLKQCSNFVPCSIRLYVCTVDNILEHCFCRYKDKHVSNWWIGLNLGQEPRGADIPFSSACNSCNQLFPISPVPSPFTFKVQFPLKWKWKVSAEPAQNSQQVH